MKRLIIFLFFCAVTFGSTVAIAQDRSENVEAAKIAYITDKVDLSPEQAQKFWPVYNEFESKRRELMKSYRSGFRRDLDELSEQEARERINQVLDIKEKELELEKEYASKYQKVLSSKQILQLYRAEREFTKLLLKRLESKRGHR